MIDGLLFEWLSLLLRWLHVITAIAWIGASFYFVWLDNSLEAPPDWKAQKGIKGDLWAFHGGGIYEVAKYQLAPQKMPDNLHWFKWEAYSTWITGALLLIVVYYIQADLYLINPNSIITEPLFSILASIAFLTIGVAIYEILIKLEIPSKHALFISIMIAYVIAFAWIAHQLFSPRAAYLHMGALIASIMAANVFFGIIPAQKGFIKAINSGNSPNSKAMELAKTRSIHNNYFTLPVIFTMISNHYAFLYGHRFNWIVLVVIMITTAYARHFFNLRHKGVIKPQILLQSAGIIAALILLMLFEKYQSLEKINTELSNQQEIEKRILFLVNTHCTNCHSQRPTFEGFQAAPAGIVLESIDNIKLYQSQLYSVVSSQYMPLGNITNMTDEQRDEFLRIIQTIK